MTSGGEAPEGEASKAEAQEGEAPKDEASTEEGSKAGRRRLWASPWARLAMGLVIIGVLVVLVLKFRSAGRDVSTTFHQTSPSSLPWLVLALAAEAVSFYCYASVQRLLLQAGGARLSRRAMFGLAVASTGLTNLVPGGVAPAGGWLVGQYRRRGIPMPLALWSVLAGGVTAAVSVLALLLVGAGIDGLAGAPLLGLGAFLIVGVTTALVLASHRVGEVDRWLDRHPALRKRRLVEATLNHAATAARFRATFRFGTSAYVLSLCNWLMDVVVLVSAFLMLGLPVPWRGVVFAYAVAQIAGSLTPLPGGIGVVEGGMVGAFAIVGTPVSDALVATIIYRAITSWAVAGVGSVALVVISRRDTVELARLEGAAARLEAVRRPPEHSGNRT